MASAVPDCGRSFATASRHHTDGGAAAVVRLGALPVSSAEAPPFSRLPFEQPADAGRRRPPSFAIIFHHALRRRWRRPPVRHLPRMAAAFLVRSGPIDEAVVTERRVVIRVGSGSREAADGSSVTGHLVTLRVDLALGLGVVCALS
ncbi:MAG: hypothetical protein IPI67_07695 [Myxococcales bacterium]|nr:hypothetical protein [Myxococcales bacterium]